MNYLIIPSWLHGKLTRNNVSLSVCANLAELSNILSEQDVSFYVNANWGIHMEVQPMPLQGLKGFSFPKMFHDLKDLDKAWKVQMQEIKSRVRASSDPKQNRDCFDRAVQHAFLLGSDIEEETRDKRGTYAFTAVRIDRDTIGLVPHFREFSEGDVQHYGYGTMVSRAEVESWESIFTEQATTMTHSEIVGQEAYSSYISCINNTF